MTSQVLNLAHIDTVAAALGPTLRYTVMLSTLASVSCVDGVSALIESCQQTLTTDAMAQFVDLSLRALVKLTPVMGAPKTYLAASIIHDSLNNDIKSKLDKTRFRSDSDTDYETILNRGMSFLRILGGFKSSIIFEKASAICPELKYLAPVDIYGRIVSSGQIMPLKETELCIYASAVAQGIPLIGEPHARGAIYFGATDDEIEAARNLGIMALNMIS